MILILLPQKMKEYATSAITLSQALVLQG